MNIGTEVCYLCLQKDSVSAFVRVNSQRDLRKQVNYCLNIKIYDCNDDTFICKECINNLRKFYDFRKKCRTLNKQFRKIKSVETYDSKIYKSKQVIHGNLSSDDERSEVIAKQEFDEINSTINNINKEFKNDGKEPNLHENSQNIYNLAINSTQFNRISNDKKNRQISPETKPVQCDVCGKIYRDERTLKKHLTETHGDKQYSCKICDKKFTRAEHKVVHMRAHSGIRPFICEVCARGFTKKQDLLRHMLVHSEEKRFCCPRCDRRFKRPGDVRSHMRSHTGLKPYSCPTCHRSYSSHSGLKKHLRTNCRSGQSTASVPCQMEDEIG